MTDVSPDWRIDESVQQTSYNDNVREFPEYINGQSTPAQKTYAGYVSPDETTIISVSELTHVGSSDDTELFVYLYEVADELEHAPFWLFDAGSNVERVKEIARRLAVAREETPYAPGDIDFIADLRKRVPELSVHTEYANDSYTEYAEERGISLDLPDPTDHPLEAYLPGYVVGTQFQKYFSYFECHNPDCSRQIEGAMELSREPNSSLYLGENDDGVIVPEGWRCAEHSTDSLDTFMTDVLDPKVVSEWKTRINEERSLIDSRVNELQEADGFDSDEENNNESEYGNGLDKRQQARQELEDEGILEEYTEAERKERDKILGISTVHYKQQYYLVRCDVDCVQFGAYYQNVSYIRNPVVLDERQNV